MTLKMGLCFLLLCAMELKALPADEPVIPPAKAKSAETKTVPSSSTEPTAAGDLSTPSTDPAHRKFHWPLALDLRGGFVLDTTDDDVQRRWTHQAGSSYMAAVALNWNFPKIIYRNFWFFSGLGFTFIHDEESIDSSLATSTVASNQFQWDLIGGLTFSPKAWDYQFGASFYPILPLWGRKHTTFSSAGFSREFERDYRLLGAGLDVYYEFEHHWRPILGLQMWRVSPILTLGFQYAF